MFAIANGRKALWQWDLNQQLTVAGDCTEVHYLDRGAPSTLTVAVKDGKADIPNILLQKAGRLVVYAYIIDAQDHHTKVCETFGIAPRPKPAEYVYTETEVKTWSDLQAQIGDLADLATDEKGSLVAAINEAAKSGGGGGAGAWYVTLTPDDDGNITADKTMAEIEAAYQAGYAVYCIFLYYVIFALVPVIAPLTIHRANAQYTFCGVGTMDKLYSFQFELTESGWTVLQKEIPQKSDIPAAYILPKATANALGGVKADPATADDTQPVRIDDSGKLVTAAGSGSSGEVWELINTLTITEENAVAMFSIDRDSNGKTFSLKKATMKAVLTNTKNAALKGWVCFNGRGTYNSGVHGFVTPNYLSYTMANYSAFWGIEVVPQVSCEYNGIKHDFFSTEQTDIHEIEASRYQNTEALIYGTIELWGVRT